MQSKCFLFVPMLLGIQGLHTHAPIGSCAISICRPKSVIGIIRLRGGGPVQHDSLPVGTSPQNFGTASARDSIVYGSFRPGYSQTSEVAGAVDDSDVSSWATYMREHGVKRFVCLLNDDEMEFYRTPLDRQLVAAGIDPSHWIRAPVKSAGAADTILSAFRAAEAAGDKVVVHCSGGSGRTALAMGLWLTAKYGLTPEAACKEIAEHAAAVKVVRSPDPVKLAAFIERRTLAKQ